MRAAPFGELPDALLVDAVVTVPAGVRACATTFEDGIAAITSVSSEPAATWTVARVGIMGDVRLGSVG